MNEDRVRWVTVMEVSTVAHPRDRLTLAVYPSYEDAVAWLGPVYGEPDWKTIYADPPTDSAGYRMTVYQVSDEHLALLKAQNTDGHDQLYRVFIREVPFKAEYPKHYRRTIHNAPAD